MSKGSEGGSFYVAVATVAFVGGAIATELYKYRKNSKDNARQRRNTESRRSPRAPKQEDAVNENDEKNNVRPPRDRANSAETRRLLELFKTVKLNSELDCGQVDDEVVEKLQFEDVSSMEGGERRNLPKRVIYSSLSFCELSEVVATQRVCKSWQSVGTMLIGSRNYRRAVAKRGFPVKLHGKCWMVLSEAKFRRKGAYEYLVERGSVETMDEKTKHDLSEVSIQRDIPRTLPNHMLFKDAVKQQHLFNVLKAYAVHDKIVGYVQGMNFITALLTTKYTEEESFWMLDCIMNRYDARTVFVPDLPRLAIALYQFEKLLSLYLPDLASHFETLGIRPNMYASEWFMTLFCYSFPLETVERIWDLFFVDGWLTIHMVGLAILHRAQDDLVKLDFDKCVPYLKRYPEKSVFEPEGLIKLAVSFGVTHEQLDDLHNQFMVEKRYSNRYI